MTQDGNDPWASLPEDEALRRVRHSISPRWEAWVVPTTDEGIVWCARRLGDGALVHGDHPGRLLQHIAAADETLQHDRLSWS